MEQKGFTLIELLVVIAVLAILTTAVVFVLNPTELIKQARDTNRISDLAALNSAISLYLSDVGNQTWNVTSTCSLAAPLGTTSPTPIGSTTISGIAQGNCWNNNIQTVDGVGYIPIDLKAITGGSPISKLPIDPLNSTSTTNCGAVSPQGCFYAYKASTTQGMYEIDAAMESAKYRTNGSSDIETKDGGNRADWYEVGSTLDL